MFSIGVDLGATSIRIGVITDQGEVISKTRRWTESRRGVQSVIDTILDGIKAVTDKISYPISEAIGIGIGAAGQIHPTTGEVIFAPNLGWDHVPLKELLSSTLRKTDPRWTSPILVDNDVRVVTWGEYKYGAGKDKSRLICIFVGSGVGSGIIIEGKMLRGQDNTAGEVGHTIVRPGGLLCNCGNQGCLELYCGGLHLKNRAIQAINSGRKSIVPDMVGHKLEEITPEILHQAEERGDPLASELWSQAKEYLSIAVINLTTLFNPEMIILGGGVITSCKSLLPAVGATVKSNIHLVARGSVQVVESCLDDDAGVLGAAAMVFDEFESR
jgi:glucokinase